MQQTTDTSTNKTLDPISGVSFMGLLKALWQGKITVILCTLVAGGMSIFYSLSLPNQYQSSVLLSPVNDDSNAKLSGISQGLASFTGTSLNGGGVDAIDVGLETIQSRQFLLDFINYQPPGLGGVDCACAFFGLSIIKVPTAVSAAYFPIFFIASFLVIPEGVFSIEFLFCFFIIRIIL